MDELQALYDVYMQNGILGQATTFEQFSAADDSQLENLYNQGLSARLLSQQTDLNTFKSAWAVKKKEATGSVSEVGISEQQETVESPTSAPIQPPQEETSFGSDLIKSWNQGRAQAQSIDDVLKIVTQGREVSDTELNNYIKAVQEIQSIGTTEGMQQFQKEYEEGGKDVGSFILALGKNLDVIPEVVASSIASMIAPDVAVGAGIGAVGGAATGAGLTAIGGPLALFGAGAGGIGGAVAGGTAVLEGTLSFTEFLQEELAEQGLDFTPEGIRSVLESEEAISNIKNRALKRGVAIGLVEALTFGLANKVGGKLARGVGTPALLKSAGAQTVIEGTGGGVGESVGRAVAGQEQDVADIGLEFFAELPGATLSGATTLFKRPKYTIKGETGVINRVSQDQFIKFIEKATPEELISANLQAVNDQKVSNVLDAKMEEAQLKVNLKKAYPDLSEENLNKLVPLQKRLTDLKNNPVDTEDVQKTVKEQINQITNAVQKPSPTEVDVSQPSQDSPTVGEGDTQGTAVTRETETVETDQTTEPAQEGEVETEVSETEEITYTLPEDPKEARKDFDVIDNRKGKAGLEYEFDGIGARKGEGNYYVENNKTGSQVTATTRKEAEFLAKNPKEWAYGEGESIIIRDQKTIADAKPSIQEVTESETVREISIGKNKVKTKAGKVLSIVNEKNEKVSLAVGRKIEKKLIQDGIVDIDGTILQQQEIPTRNVDEFIVENSKSPRQLAETINSLQEVKKQDLVNIDEAKVVGLGSLFGQKKFSPESIQKITGFKNLQKELGSGFVRTWISKDKSRNINIEDGVQDENGNTYEADEIIEFITQYPTRKDYIQQFDNASQLLADAKIKFTQLTGLKATPTNINEAIKAPRQEDIAFREERQAEDAAIEKRIQDAIESNTPQKRVPKKKVKTKEDIRQDKREKKQIVELSRIIRKIKKNYFKLSMSRLETRIANLFRRTKIGLTEDAIRKNPTAYIDAPLGNPTGTQFYRTLIRPLETAFNPFRKDFRRLQNKVINVADSLSKDHNENISLGYMIRLFQIAREFETNNNPDISPDPVTILNLTIEKAARGEIYNDLDLKVLKDLSNRFEKNGQIKSSDVLAAMTPKQKKALKFLDNENKALENKIKVVFERAGLDVSPELLNNYSHRVVLRDSSKKDVDILIEKAKSFYDSTKGGTEIFRTEGAKPMSFDPFESLLRGAQETLIAFYLKPTADKVQRITKSLKNIFQNQSKEQREAGLAVNNVVRELLESAYIRSFIDANNKGGLINEARKIGYRILLSSGSRFGAELLGNALMLISEDPKVIKDSYTKYKNFSMKVGEKANEKYIRLLENLKSSEVAKLSGATSGETKYADVDNFLNLKKGRKLQGPIQKKLGFIKNTAGMTYNAISKISDFLMSGADRVISRPIWVSKFANEFQKNVKKINNEDINLTVKDLDEIANGTSKYLDKIYKPALNEAVLLADRTSTQLITSGNPFNTIIANVRRGDKSVADYYRLINSFMARFTINEYATARFAVSSLFRNGEISKQKAFRTFAGVLGRMSAYVVLYNLLSQYMDSLYAEVRGKDIPEEDKDYSLMSARQAVGSAMTLLFRQNLGNIPALPINFGAEYINKNYLEKLRDGAPYNSYENSIVYSLIQLDKPIYEDNLDTVVPILAGPFGPYANAIKRTAKTINRSLNLKTEEGREKAKKQLKSLTAFELIGMTGFIPLYKDLIRAEKKIYYQDQKDD